LNHTLCHLKIWPKINRKCSLSSLYLFIYRSKCCKWLKINYFNFSFVSGLELLNNIDDKKFVRLIDRMIRDFEPNRLSSFSEHELASMEKSLKLNSSQCQCLLNCLSQLLKEVNIMLIYCLKIKFFLTCFILTFSIYLFRL